VISAIRAGQDALARGAWSEALARFENAVGGGPDAWEGLGMAAWWMEKYARAIEARSEAYRLYRRKNDRRAAARMAFYLAMDYADYRSELAVAQGWLARARRLLEGLPPSPEQAMVLLMEGHQALMSANDTVRARRCAAEAIEIARLAGPPDAEVLGLAMEGLAQVSEGRVAEGMGLLDEATAAALAGDLSDYNAIGTACCYLIHACERVCDLERAAQWCDRVQQFCRERNFTSMFTVCRTHYASVLIWQGAWAEAEAQLSAATDELRATRPAAISSGLIRLAELRRRQGRMEEAEKLFEQAPHHRLALLGRAEIALSESRGERAGDLVAQYLRRFPAQTRTERVVGLELAVRVKSAVGDLEAARVALDELKETAAMLSTDPQRATALYAEGILARASGEVERARICFEDASDLFDRSGIPFEGGRARLALAQALAALGRRDEARAEAERARDGFVRLGAKGESAAAEVALRDLDGASVKPEAPPGKVLTPREVEVLRCIARGLNDKEIADRLFLSQHTVHRHVSNILSKLDLPSRAAAVAYGSRRGIL
jgi:DNA-binding CsgD family transcriptional regulator